MPTLQQFAPSPLAPTAGKMTMELYPLQLDANRALCRIFRSDVQAALALAHRMGLFERRKAA